MRGLVQSMGYVVDESRTEDIRRWFQLMSRRIQGVAHYDVETLTGDRRDFFLVDKESAEDLRGDIQRTADRLPLKLCRVEIKSHEEKAGCLHSEERT